METLRQQLIRHEGLRLEVYECSNGFKTIGIGRNIQTNGISEDEAFLMLDNDIKNSATELESFSWWKDLDQVRKDCLINMVFNLGLPTFKKFKGMISAIENKDFQLASLEMLDSRWAKQVKGRSKELSEQMRTGRRQDG